MTKYRTLVNELDSSLKMDGGIGYYVFSVFVLWMTFILGYGVWLEVTTSHLR